MTTPKFPAVLTTAEGECGIQEDFALDLPPTNKFSVAYAPSDPRPPSIHGVTSPKESLSSSDGEGDHQTSDGDEESDSCDESGFEPRTSSYQLEHAARPSEASTKTAPNISRTLSMPFPSQLTQLQHPHRPSPVTSFRSSPHVLGEQSSQVREVSVELADSIQMAIQTMLQISPPQVLDPAKEQFSACSLSVPTSSMSAMFTAMKNINYLSANMSAFCEHEREDTPQVGEDSTPPVMERCQASAGNNEFDVGEMLQCIGDALSGTAAQLGVDLVLYHGDVGLRQVYVSGDESGISFALSHIIRQVLNTAERGDSIEVGLLVSPIRDGGCAFADPEPAPIDDMMSSLDSDSDGRIQCTVRISHKYALLHSGFTSGHPPDVVTTEHRSKPVFSTLLLRRILKHIDGTLQADLPPPETFTTGRTCELKMILRRVPLSTEINRLETEEDEALHPEPSLDLLLAFGETLKDKRAMLCTSVKGSFSHHLTNYLTAWGMEITHGSRENQAGGSPGTFSNKPKTSNSPVLTSYFDGTSSPGSRIPESRQSDPGPPCFIIIDDDIDVLKEQLQALRCEQPTPQALPLNTRKRPPLSTNNNRSKSSPQVARILALSNLPRPPTPVVILHFTSLSNYKLLKDVMNSIMTSYSATSTPLPEVMIIPKPAGPRRILTALHTAVTRPIVDPFFMPIATSPASPSPQNMNHLVTSPSNEYSTYSQGGSGHGTSQAASPTAKNTNRPTGSRSNSDRSTRSTDATITFASALPPSPLAFPENVEYFSPASEKLGTSPSSGLIIQSPDGQPAGIYFHPRSKSTSKMPPSQPMERDRGQLSVPSPRRGSMPRIPSGGSAKGDAMTFASLHEVQQGSPTKVPVAVAASRLASGAAGALSEEPALEPSPLSRKMSTGEKKAASPSTSPGPSRRAGRRPTSESRDPSSTRTKGRPQAPTDRNVVPPISVLIVDDNPINQTILSTFMKRKKIKYDVASNGQEAVQKWRTGGFHLILMDIQMPVMDGIQATKEIRRLEKANAAAGYPPMTPSTESHTSSEASMSSAASTSSTDQSMNSPYRSSVIIVALTASSLQTDRVAALAAGCNDFLTKPVSLLWLNNKIIEWGSIKALQMWADIRPDALTSISSGQAAHARSVADRLHVPSRNRGTPSPTRRTSVLEDNAAALALANSAGAIPNITGGIIPPSPTSAMFLELSRSPGLPNLLSNQAPQSSSLDSSTLIPDVLDSQPFGRKSGDSIESNFDTPKTELPRVDQSRSIDSKLLTRRPHPETSTCTLNDDPPIVTSQESEAATRPENGRAQQGLLSLELSSSLTSAPIPESVGPPPDGCDP